jgi:general secretion pathway protein A
MYERFYGLQENPFTLTPDPAFLYMGRQHQHALTLLEYALQQGSGFALVSGEIGSGKTTVVNYLLSRVQRGLRIGVMNNTHPGIGSLLPWVMQCFGGQCLPSSASEQYEEFAQFLEREHHGGRRAVLIIDEAQNLTTDGLEELRVLSNLNSGKALLLQTILVGQPELRTTLRSRRMKQFAQRIAMDYHITPLCLADTHEYIRHRLKVAGGNPDLFSPAARALVHKSSDGVPRLINQVCDTALVYGFGEQSQLIGKEIIGQVLVDRRVGGLLPLMHPLRAIAREAAVD